MDPAHWTDTLQPALIQHLWLTAIAVGIGFGIAFACALMAHRFGRLAAPFGVFSAFLYTIPSIALFQLLVPVTGITVTTIEIGLVGYTLLILFRNTLAGLRRPPDVLEAARGMGLTRSQILRRVELPLALPAISAGIRISVVTTISLATVAAYITPYGLGKPILDGLQINYRTEYVRRSARADLSLARTASGKVLAWGSNFEGELGNGSTADSDIPVRVRLPGTSKVTSLAASAFFAVAGTSGGRVYSWGANNLGQLGTGSSAESSDMPVRVAISQSHSGPVRSLFAGCGHVLALFSPGCCWPGAPTSTGSSVSAASPPSATSPSRCTCPRAGRSRLSVPAALTAWP